MTQGTTLQRRSEVMITIGLTQGPYFPRLAIEKKSNNVLDFFKKLVIVQQINKGPLLIGRPVSS
jgi:hypothetical protein